MRFLQRLYLTSFDIFTEEDAKELNFVERFSISVVRYVVHVNYRSRQDKLNEPIRRRRIHLQPALSAGKSQCSKRGKTQVRISCLIGRECGASLLTEHFDQNRLNIRNRNSPTFRKDQNWVFGRIFNMLPQPARKTNEMTLQLRGSCTFDAGSCYTCNVFLVCHWNLFSFTGFVKSIRKLRMNVSSLT